ncbi:hypothetical protein NDU88_002751 [Pleurodeles waltl]|uniref:Uncharacterized protein n=1 Tax=Pleurodeles waltl TaxID=8319 RepID=A0AAV7W4X8_PLEWA|nr:hypothetical protein NDU88_002751 [Pleurodeles waltl]
MVILPGFARVSERPGAERKEGSNAGTAGLSGCWELHFQAALGIPRYSPKLWVAARGSYLKLPPKHNNDESAAPALSRELCYRPPRPPDDKITGCGGD